MRDTLAPSSFGQIGRGQRDATQDHPTPSHAHNQATPGSPRRGRAPLPTLNEGQIHSATATLRPPGAVPPPARGVPTVPTLDASNPFSFERRAATATPLPRTDPSVHAGEPHLASAARMTPETLPPSAPILLTERASELEPLTPNDSGMAARALPAVAPVSTGSPAAQAPPRASPLEPARPPLLASSSNALAGLAPPRDAKKLGPFSLARRSALLALSGLCATLFVALVALAFTRRPAAEAAPVAAPAKTSIVAPSRPASAPPGCRVSVSAALLANGVERSVPPYAAQFGPELALTFAASKTKGVGLRVNPRTLDTIAAFAEDGREPVRGVTPLTRTGSLAFFVDRGDPVLRSPHTIDEAPPFTLGVSDQGFSRVVAGTTSLVWPLESKLAITEPRAAAIGAAGYGVTFRRGGQGGAILLGFVGRDGAKRSELSEIPNAPKLLGTPVIAGNQSNVLVAFAGRDTTDSAWKIFVSLSRAGAAPNPARELISGGSGGGAISPALAALGKDGWLVQWTEGSSGHYQVRVQSFDADLKPSGEAVLASPNGANAGQGSLTTFDERALSSFILTTAGHDELWGTILTCR